MPGCTLITGLILDLSTDPIIGLVIGRGTGNGRDGSHRQLAKASTRDSPGGKRCRKKRAGGDRFRAQIGLAWQTQIRLAWRDLNIIPYYLIFGDLKLGSPSEPDLGACFRLPGGLSLALLCDSAGGTLAQTKTAACLAPTRFLHLRAYILPVFSATDPTSLGR